MIQQLLELWIISGIFAILSIPITSYILAIISTGYLPPFIYHLTLVFYGLGGRWQDVLKVCIGALAMGPIALVAYNIIIINTYLHDNDRP